MEELASAMLRVFSVKTESKQPIIGVNNIFNVPSEFFETGPAGVELSECLARIVMGVVLGCELLLCYDHGFSQHYVSRISKPTNDNTECICNIEFRRSSKCADKMIMALSFLLRIGELSRSENCGGGHRYTRRVHTSQKINQPVNCLDE
jgi:hypothetical protein